MTSERGEYSLTVSASFRKDLRKLPRENQIRVRQALGKILADPYQGRKIRNAAVGQYRWRVGDYRIRYDIEGHQIQVLRVLKREDAYRRF
ncbi:MAG: type II toxin-antitoxin system RelE/ParE family toxin [Anaerolineae bacterium]|nr:type II toxin-antitoxin system RelE/ParE family toxin [Anaerolineae bacterium]